MNLDKLIESFEKTENFYKESLGKEKIVFVHDSCVRIRGQVYNFQDNEYSTLTSLINKTNLPADSYQFLASIKELGVTEKEATTPDLHKHRPLVKEDLEKINPNLIFLLGNLAMKVVIKKSGITNKRGKEYSITLNGKPCPVVPVNHPFVLYTEPKSRPLFIQDVNNSYDKFILNKNRLADSSYCICKTLSSVVGKIEDAISNNIISIDLETTGLDYKKDKILTFGVSMKEGEAFVIPIHHKESPFSNEDLEKIKDLIKKLMVSNVRKVFHNCKFDLKFLKNWGVDKFNNIDDTQIMHSLVDENLPHGLMDLVKEFFPKELEKF